MTGIHLPKNASIIIGADIAKCSIAYFLAKYGADVVLLDKGYLFNKQSGRNWGGCAGKATIHISET